MADRWLGAVEGYYGPPLPHAARLRLVEWLGAHGFNCYAYAPKDDPYHRAQWREPYPDDRMREFAELRDVAVASGVDLALVVSPGLDWKQGDEAALVAKLAAFRDLGAPVLGVAWDDVPPGGAALGAAHGAAVAAAVAAVGDGVRWVTCPTDYATSRPTPYLEALVANLPEQVEVMWTGPAIVSPTVTGAEARELGRALGRKLLFAENFPVNDGAMSGVLHLGPYPPRDPDLVAETTGVFCNFMSLPVASRLGLAVAARFWQDPRANRETAWRECLAELPGLEPLARASRSWVGTPDPDPELLAWADAALSGDGRLRAYLQQGCRDGLDPELAAEVEPWLTQWDFESHAMQFALTLLDQRPARPAELAFVTAELWRRARNAPAQVFGVRWAYYPVTDRLDGRLVATPDALVTGENLTDRLCRLALSSPG